jgi:hypothetical protein
LTKTDFEAGDLKEGDTFEEFRTDFAAKLISRLEISSQSIVCDDDNDTKRRNQLTNDMKNDHEFWIAQNGRLSQLPLQA